MFLKGALAFNSLFYYELFSPEYFTYFCLFGFIRSQIDLCTNIVRENKQKILLSAFHLFSD